MRFNGLKSHLRLQKLRFLDAPGLFLLEIVLTGAYDLADVLANVLVLKWMIGALMGRDLIRAAWVLGGFLVYQLSVSFLWHWYFERIYPQWKERLEYKLNCRLYRIMLDADCRKYNEESYFHGYRRALQFTQTKMEETLEFYRQLFGSFLAGAVAVVIYIRMDQMIVVFVLLAFVASRFCVKSLVEKRTQSGMNRTKRCIAPELFTDFSAKGICSRGADSGLPAIFRKTGSGQLFAKGGADETVESTYFSNCVRAGDRERFSVYRLFDDRVSGILFFLEKDDRTGRFCGAFERDAHHPVCAVRAV